MSTPTPHTPGISFGDPTVTRVPSSTDHDANPSTLTAGAAHGESPTQVVGTTPTPFAPHLPRYQLLESVGHGGMGQVFRATDLQLGREVAVKFLLKQADAPAAVVERFARESRILAQLDHPNVVPVYDSGEASGYLYYVMKYVPGGSLGRQAGAVRASAARAAELVRKVARAVQYVHDRGVLHRDLKPGNILVDAEGEPLVVDFGVSKWDDGESHTTGYAMFGTPAYMAPEVTRQGSKAGGQRAEVWSLGVILYELLAGDRPFPGDRHDPDLFRRIQEDTPPPLRAGSAVLADADERLEAVCRKCLAKDPAGRYATAAELADDLQRWADGLAVAAPSAFDDATTVAMAPRPKLKRKSGWRIAAAIAASIVLAGVAVEVTSWALKRAAHHTPDTAPNRPPVEPSPIDDTRPLTERLAKPGDSVLFIGDTGLPAKVVGEIGGQPGARQTDPFGLCLLTSTGFYGVVLADEPLPFPWRFEADVEFAHIVGQGKAGVFTLHKRHPQPDGTVVHAAHVNCFGAPPTDPKNPRRYDGKLVATSSEADLLPPSAGPFHFAPLAATWKEVPEDPTPAAGQPGTAHHLVVENDGATVAAWWGDQRLPDRTFAAMRGSLKNALRPPDLPQFAVNGDALGDGIGLFVLQGNAAFHNVRLTRK